MCDFMYATGTELRGGGGRLLNDGNKTHDAFELYLEVAVNYSSLNVKIENKASTGRAIYFIYKP